MDKKEFEKYRDLWKKEWYNHWRLLDIDFEGYMRMGGMSKTQFNKLNNVKNKRKTQNRLFEGMDCLKQIFTRSKKKV